MSPVRYLVPTMLKLVEAYNYVDWLRDCHKAPPLKLADAP